MDLAVVVPFHNEERYLPSLVRALREQTTQDVPIVFIDNASIDGSAAVVRQTEEVRIGKWIYLAEPRIGKLHAIRTATAYCRDQFDARHIGFLDSDSYPSDRAWLSNSLDIIDAADGQLGFTYSPLRYVGFEEFPVFKSAYLAYEGVQHDIMKAVGWLANGQGFVCSAETMTTYLTRAQLTTEFDLRSALLALMEGRQAYLNPTLLVTSGRRITVNARNFEAWCFYEREDYSKKDINANAKLNLDVPERVVDLAPRMVRRFFERRASKLVARHILPLAIFDPSGSYFDRIRAAFDVDVEEALSETAARFRNNQESLFTNEFDDMIQLIEDDPATPRLSGRIADLMWDRFEQMTAPAVGAQTV